MWAGAVLLMSDAIPISSRVNFVHDDACRETSESLRATVTVRRRLRNRDGSCRGVWIVDLATPVFPDGSSRWWFPWRWRLPQLMAMACANCGSVADPLQTRSGETALLRVRISFVPNPQCGGCFAAGWCDVRDGSAVWVGLCCGSVICSCPTRSEGSRCLRVGVVFVINPQFVRGGALLLLRVGVMFVTDPQSGLDFVAGLRQARVQPAVKDPAGCRSVARLRSIRSEGSCWLRVCVGFVPNPQ